MLGHGNIYLLPKKVLELFGGVNGRLKWYNCQRNEKIPSSIASYEHSLNYPRLHGGAGSLSYT
jgi:hypothetical protein